MICQSRIDVVKCMRTRGSGWTLIHWPVSSVGIEHSLHMRGVEGSNPSLATVNQCLVCNSLNNYPLCAKCSRKPFLVEKARQILASINDLKTLRKTYNLRYAQIKDLNTSTFWNKLLSIPTNLEAQDGMTKDRIKTVFAFLPKNARKILDIGTGQGLVEELLSKNKNIRIFGNDIASTSIKKLQSKFKGHFLKESVYDMKFRKKSFDAIFMLEVLEHIPPSKVLNVLRKVREMLNKKGSFIISIPTNEGLEKKKDNLSGHVRTYAENLIRSELKMTGFKILKLRKLYAFKNFYTLKKISAKIFRKRWQPNNIVILAKPV